MRLAELAEIISDDAALELLEDRPSYAFILLDVAGNVGRAPAAIAMARACTVGRRVERILRAYEDGIALLRQERGVLPRSLNFITGPSRSGDIEQTLQLGAHGPRRLCVLLVDESPGVQPAAP